MRVRTASLLLPLLLLGCGGGGDAGLTKARQLKAGDRWEYSRTTTTIESGQTTTDQATASFRVETATFQGDTRLTIGLYPSDYAVQRLVIRQDTFSRQIDLVGTKSGSTESTYNAIYIPGTLRENDTFPTLIVTPTEVLTANARVGRQESVTVIGGTYQAHKVVATSGNVTMTYWLRPGMGAAVKIVIVENSQTRTRTIDYQLTSTNASG